MAFLLPEEVDVFPHPLSSDQDGFLAASDSLSVERLLLAYQFGIFPWNNPDDPILWWYTHPRCVLYPQNVKVQKSMRTYLNSDKFRWSIDESFGQVIEQCKTKKRDEQGGTWITEPLKKAFVELHNRGYAHSVEVWEGDNLVGGLYGMSLGKVFFGESMFAHTSNASKFALIKLSEWLEERGFWLIDCQQETDHLMSMGAELMDKKDFFDLLKKNIFENSLMGPWRR